MARMSASSSSADAKSAGPPLLRVRDLVTTFRTDQGVLRAVDEVSFDVAEGATLGIVGESGCGKSVTALSILRLIPYPQGLIDEGRIEFRGKDLLGLTERQMQDVRGNDISMIFQEPMTSLNPVYSVGTQIIEAIRLHQKKSRKEARARALEMLRLVGIPAPETNIDAYPHQLSGGMRQRVMIAMALSCEPSLLIADEPTTALDVTIQAQILELLATLKGQLGMGIVLITHDLGVVAEVCTDVVVMYAGRIVESAKVERLFAHPRHPYTRGLLGSLPTFDKAPLAAPATPERDTLLAGEARAAELESVKTGPGGEATAKPRRARLPVIEGLVPDLHALPPGCRFADRCPMVIPACLEAEPELVPIRAEGFDPLHLARCIRADEV
ncbi:MAG: Oligopeptide transport system permease protein OppB [Myxococcaceae bacterium]|nr:Oligopeptide transport system permease protein OppB [Myxococcaceae bacterium]